MRICYMIEEIKCRLFIRKLRKMMGIKKKSDLERVKKRIYKTFRRMENDQKIVAENQEFLD